MLVGVFKMKKRYNFTFDDEVNVLLEKLAKKKNLNKSQYLSMVITQLADEEGIKANMGYWGSKFMSKGGDK